MISRVVSVPRQRSSGGVFQLSKISDQFPKILYFCAKNLAGSMFATKLTCLMVTDPG